MRRAVFVLIGLLLIGGTALAQPRTKVSTMLNTTYDSGIDTSVAFSVSANEGVSLIISCADSAQLAVNVDYRGSAAQNWITMTPAAGDTLITVSNTGAAKGLELRDWSATNRIPGGGEIRVRIDGVNNLGDALNRTYSVLLQAFWP